MSFQFAKFAPFYDETSKA